MSIDPAAVLKRPNLEILSLLKTEARNPRELAKILGKHETHISSRLRFMERTGLVKGKWIRRDGKNVKAYELRTDSIQLTLTPEGYEARFSSSSGPVIVPLFAEVRIPTCPNFVGRKKELEFLNSAGNFIVVEGTAGIGKTWLVAHFVGQLPSKEIFWHCVKGFDIFDSVVRKLAVFLRAQGNTELYDYVKSNGPDGSVKLELLTKEVDHRRNILVFDDYNACSDKNIDDLLKYLKNNLTKAQVIVVSRTRPRLASESGVTELLLQGFTLEETAAFISIRGIRCSRTLVNLVQEKLHGHPLSLEFLSEGSKGTVVESALDSVRESKLLHYFWTQIYENLAEPERDLLRIMSVFRMPASMDALRFVCGSKVAFSIYELKRKHLITELGEKYSIHDLVREMAYRLLDSPEEVHKKIADFFLKDGSYAGRVEAVYHLLHGKAYEKIAEIVQGNYNIGDRIVTSEYAVPYMQLLRTVPIGSVSKKRQAYILVVIGRIERFHGSLKESAEIFSEALEIAERQGDVALAAKVMAGLGRAYFEMGAMGKAESFMLRAAAHFSKEQQAMRLLAETYNYLSYIYQASGLMDKALTYAHRCLRSAKAVNSPRIQSLHSLGLAYSVLGDLYATMGMFPKAKYYLNRALREFLQLFNETKGQDQIGVPYVELSLISLYEEWGKLKEAEELCEKQIEVWKNLREMLPYFKARRARLLLRIGRVMDAENELNELVKMIRTLKGRRVLGDVEVTLGMFHSKTKRWSEAVRHFEKALHFMRPEVYGLARAHQEFATMWLEKGNFGSFKSHAGEAIKLLRMVGAEHRVRQLETLLSRTRADIPDAIAALSPTEAGIVR